MCVRYQGGKYRIAIFLADKIRELHPNATEIWEPFCGGGAVTLALAKAGFRVHASDNHEDLILMWQALMRGETEPFVDVTEVEHAALKTAQPSARRGFVGFGASFGGVFFGGFARQGAAGAGYASNSERMRSGKYQAWHEAYRSLLKLADRPVTFKFCDYTSVPDDVLVYADPPYLNTTKYKTGTFDHAAFWSWVRHRKGPTFISELTGPEDIDIVWRKTHKSQNASNSPTTKATAQIVTREERLYYKPGQIISS
ncbi:MAG: DNA adenine methylase [Desulfurellales bacterium]|nr:MAG: DNA adenine methylase [Desulfurellales bacterium]